MQLDLDIADQGQNSWCWAAVTAAVLNHFEKTALRPCDVAGVFFNAEDCCDHPEDFDTLERLRDVLPVFGLLRFPERDALPDEEIAAELAADRPIPARVVFGNGRVHFVLITGLLANGNKIVLDPDGAVERELSDVDLRFRFPSADGPADGSWSNSYLVKPP
jgi:hypothetical protein